MDTKILENDKSNVKDKSNFLKTDDIVVVERYNQLGKKKKLNDEKDYKKKKKKKKELKARIEIVTGLMVNGIEKRLE